MMLPSKSCQGGIGLTKFKQTSHNGGRRSICVRRATKTKNEPRAGLLSAICWLVRFLLCTNCRNQCISTHFLISCVCILLDLYFTSEMRSRSVSNQKEYCTKSVHVQILYIIRVIHRCVSTFFSELLRYSIRSKTSSNLVAFEPLRGWMMALSI